MYNGLITACDACGKVLRGRVGTAEMHHRFVEVSGTMDICVKNFDTKESKDTFVYCTDKIRKDRLHFCAERNSTCFYDWCEIKEKMYLDKRLENLRAEAQWESQFK